MDLEAAKGDNWRQVKATNCGKFIAAFCRFLSLGFEPRFFQTISLGDGVYPILPLDTGKMNANFWQRANVCEFPLQRICVGCTDAFDNRLVSDERIGASNFTVALLFPKSATASSSANGAMICDGASFVGVVP